MERDGKDRIDLLEKDGRCRLLQETIRQPIGQRPAAMIFELVNESFYWICIDAEANDVSVWVKSLSQTARAGGIRLRQGQGAVCTGRGEDEIVELGCAGWTERAAAIAEGLAMDACCWISQIGYPGQHSP